MVRGVAKGMLIKVKTKDCFLSATEVEKLLAIGTTAKYHKGQFIFSAGIPAVELHYILSGWVNVFKVNDQGRQISVGLRYAGEFAGLGSFACLDERGCYAKAMIDTKIAILPRELFLLLLKSMPELNLKIFCLLGSRLKDTQNAMMHFISNQTDKRLADTLLNIAHYLGKGAGAKRLIGLKLTQEELAHIIGCSRQTVNALITNFKEQNFIEMKGREITAVFPDPLRKVLTGTSVQNS